MHSDYGLGTLLRSAGKWVRNENRARLIPRLVESGVSSFLLL